MKIGDYVIELPNKHIGKPETCPRCQVSTRPPCISCGHALSDKMSKYKGESIIVCEYCHTVNEVDESKIV